MPSTGKLLANMHRSTPNVSMACSSHGRERVDAHRPERHRQARQLADDVVAEPGERVDARLPQRALLVGARPGPAGVLDHDDQVVEAPRARRPRPGAGRGGPSARTAGPAPAGRGARRRRGAGRRRRPSGGRPGSGTRPSAGRAARPPRPPMSVGGRPPTMASGWPSASARRSSSSVSSIEWRPVAAATFTSFSTFQPADSAR